MPQLNGVEKAFAYNLSSNSYGLATPGAAMPEDGQYAVEDQPRFQPLMDHAFPNYAEGPSAEQWNEKVNQTVPD